jgi:drug/metabolite transporter (DMT)-like permease
MSSLSLLLVVVAAVLHASWNLVSKRAAAAGAHFVLAYTLISCVAYAPFAIAMIVAGQLPVNAVSIACILASGVVHLFYGLGLQRAYQVAHLSVVYPVARGSGPLLSSIGAFLLLAESPTATRLFGLLAVVVGIGLITTQGRIQVLREPGGATALRWGLLIGFLIALYTVTDAYSIKVLGVPPLVLDWSTNAFRAIVLLPVLARQPSLSMANLKGFWRFAFWVGLVSPLSYIFVLTALKMHAPLSVVAPLREMSMMVGALFGMVFLKEPVGRWRLVGCGVLIVGVVLLSS